LTTANGSSGAPWELVKTMDQIDRAAWLIVMGELQGRKFDWSGWCWREER